MKNLLSISLIVLLLASCDGDGQIQKNLLRTQEVQTQIQEDYFVSNFVNGVAVYRDNTGMEFLVNRDGKLLTPDGYSSIRYSFTDNYAVFRNQDGLYGVMNTDGKIIIDPIYSSIGNDSSDPFYITESLFKNGKAVVRLNGKSALIDKKGKLLFMGDYDQISAKGKLIKVKKGDFYGIVDFQNNIVVPTKFDRLAHFEGDVAIGIIDYKLFRLNKNGGQELMDDSKNHYYEISESNGHFFVYSDDKGSGCIDRSGNYKFDTKAKDQISFKNGPVWIQGLNGNYGLMNSSGKMITKFKYMEAQPFQSGVAIVRRKDPKGYSYYQLVNTKGKEITTYPYGAAYDLSHNSTTIVVQKSEWVRTGNGWGVKGPLIGLTTQGKEIIFPKGAELGLSYNENLNTLMMNQRFGFVNEKGELVVECKYEFAYGLYNGSAWVRNPGSGNWSILNLK